MRITFPRYFICTSVGTVLEWKNVPFFLKCCHCSWMFQILQLSNGRIAAFLIAGLISGHKSCLKTPFNFLRTDLTKNCPLGGIFHQAWPLKFPEFFEAKIHKLHLYRDTDSAWHVVELNKMEWSELCWSWPSLEKYIWVNFELFKYQSSFIGLKESISQCSQCCSTRTAFNSIGEFCFPTTFCFLLMNSNLVKTSINI